MIKKTEKTFFKAPLKLITLMILIVAIVATIVLFLIIKGNRPTKAVPGTIKTINTQPNPNNSNSSKSNASKSSTATINPGKTSVVNTPTTDNSLAAPYGSFVSNHKPGQNGSNLTELSQCTTTPGATCYIKFTQNGVERTLPQQTVNSDGTTFWEWNINNAGLTGGQWTITAIASFNGQIKSTTDQLPLEVP
jgi:hypothetical protein